MVENVFHITLRVVNHYNPPPLIADHRQIVNFLNNNMNALTVLCLLLLVAASTAKGMMGMSGSMMMGMSQDERLSSKSGTAPPTASSCAEILGTWSIPVREASWQLIWSTDCYEPAGEMEFTISAPRSGKACTFLGTHSWVAEWPTFTAKVNDRVTGTAWFVTPGT